MTNPINLHVRICFLSITEPYQKEKYKTVIRIIKQAVTDKITKQKANIEDRKREGRSDDWMILTQ